MALSLNAVVQGDGPALVILHGLFGSAGNWRSLATSFASDYRVVALDLRNHGQSPWDDRMDYGAMADDVAQTMAEHGIDSARVIGHSMGGKAAMVLALTRPDRVAALLVADIAPVRYPRTHAPLVTALRELDLDTISSRKEADAALRSSIREMGIRAFLLQNLVSENDGPRWRVNLDVIALEMAAISDFPDQSGHYDGPTLFLGGGKSDYITDAAKPAIERYFPAATIDQIPDAGHWLHAEKPREFMAHATAFLAAT